MNNRFGHITTINQLIFGGILFFTIAHILFYYTSIGEKLFSSYRRLNYDIIITNNVSYLEIHPIENMGLRIVNKDINHVKTIANILTTERVSTERSITTKEFLINTKGCKIVSWPVFDHETQKIYKNVTGKMPKNCAENSGIKIGRINGTAIIIDFPKKLNVQCYGQIQKVRDENQDGDAIDLDSPIGPLNSVVNFENAEFVKIECFEKKIHNESAKEKEKMNDELIYDEIIPLIPVLKNRIKRNDKNIPNVLLLGIDSVSRLNFQRHFPLTKALLKEKGFYTFYGYNKVGLNTFPNMFPFLTGKISNPIMEDTSVKYKIKGFFDNETIIWKEYAKLNFRTLLFEDFAKFTIFNYVKPGFKYKPTDYYLRPFGLLIDNQTEDYCYKQKMEFEVYTNYLYDFVLEMNNRGESFFALTFLAHLTHDYVNHAGYADKHVHNLFKMLFSHNLLENTVLFFFADHGIRYGEIRQTHSGEIEARLPFMFLHLPDSMAKHKTNIEINQHRLVTPFDIHETLMHIVKGYNNDSTIGKSIFTEIPETRTCEDASIAEHFCSCHSDEPILPKFYSNFTSMAKIIVNYVNNMLKDNFDKCHELYYKNIMSAYDRHIIQENEENRNDTKIYLIQISVYPSNAIFEATVREKGNDTNVVGDISRLDRYGNQSACIKDFTLERYCFCKDV